MRFLIVAICISMLASIFAAESQSRKPDYVDCIESKNRFVLNHYSGGELIRSMAFQDDMTKDWVRARPEPRWIKRGPIYKHGLAQSGFTVSFFVLEWGRENLYIVGETNEACFEKIPAVRY